MPTCIIDGKEAEFKPGENLVEVAKRVGIEIPVFCYHPGLSVVAQCRMCMVAIEGAPKLVTACSTEAKDKMVVKTKTPEAKRAREAVMEFLLINHPLDCPICDKAGECDLQDNSYKYGSAFMRTTEERRTYLDLDMGPVIQKNMNRCIHCTRCIRFGDEIAKIREMVAVNRGNNTEITTLGGRPLETEYAGNYSDICPTGSLTLKDFRFNKRVWFLKKTPTICEGCSKGCNMEIQWDAGMIHRCVPRDNAEINRYWLCDEGRFNYRHVHHPDRIVEPSLQESGAAQISTWQKVIEASKKKYASKKAISILVGSDLTQEEVESIQAFQKKHLPSATIHHFGTPGITSTKDDADEDGILKRTNKTSNLNGVEKLGIPGLTKVSTSSDLVIVFRAGRAVLPEIGNVETIGIGVFRKDEVASFSMVLPGIAFAEKDGTVLNHQGKEQKFKRAINPPRNCKAISEVLMMWANTSSSMGAA